MATFLKGKVRRSVLFVAVGALLLSCCFAGVRVYSQSVSSAIVIGNCGGAGEGMCFETIEDCDAYFGGTGCCPVSL
jgi:hypothetical protein